MPTPRDVMRSQSVQQAQSGVFPMDFDPDTILQEIAQKDIQLQMKEQELAQKEQQLMQAAQQPPAPEQMPAAAPEQMAAGAPPAEAPPGEAPPPEEMQPSTQVEMPFQNTDDDQIMQALNTINEIIKNRQQPGPVVEPMTAPVVPMSGEPLPPEAAGGAPQQQNPDISPQTMQNVQPGQEVSVTKRIVMTPDGPG